MEDSLKAGLSHSGCLCLEDGAFFLLLLPVSLGCCLWACEEGWAVCEKCLPEAGRGERENGAVNLWLSAAHRRGTCLPPRFSHPFRH
jgi:hypothetical protein